MKAPGSWPANLAAQRLEVGGVSVAPIPVATNVIPRAGDLDEPRLGGLRQRPQQRDGP